MITILALIAVFVAAYYVAKTAKDTGRNVVLWALLTLGVGLGFQLVIPVVVTLIVAIVLLATGTPQNLEPYKCEGWAWFRWDALPEPLFAPLQALVARGYVPDGQ